MSRNFAEILFKQSAQLKHRPTLLKLISGDTRQRRRSSCYERIAALIWRAYRPGLAVGVISGTSGQNFDRYSSQMKIVLFASDTNTLRIGQFWCLKIPQSGRQALRSSLLSMSVLFLATTGAAPQTHLDELIARAKSLELDTPYVPPPGDPLAHHAAGYAKVMCTAVFMTSFAPDFAAENVGYFRAPYAVRAKLGKPVIDRASKAVHVTLPNGITRTAKYLGSQGCVTLPLGESTVHFTPVVVKSQLPDAATVPWPMGDVLPNALLPGEINAAKLKAAVGAAFEPPEAMTAAFVVTWKGRLIAERYGDGIDIRTPLEGWSMGKSITATLFGILLNRGAYELTQPAPIPEWQTPGDPRAKIRVEDLLRMSHPKTPIMIRLVRIQTISIFIQAELTPIIMQPPVRSNGRQTQLAVTATLTRC